MSQIHQPAILIIDDQPQLSRVFGKMLRQQGHAVVPASSAMDALDKVESVSTAVALVSMAMADCDGAELIRQLLAVSPETVCIALATESSAAEAVAALDAGALDYFLRPITDWSRFNHLIRQSMSVWEQSCELSALRVRMKKLQELRDHTGFFNIKGNSPSVQRVIDTVRLVAPLQVSTLIYGESGVGKELVARAIHRESPLKEGPFVAVNCAAISPELFESELFGHARGAFTGAHTRREGLCGVASNGILFLDEIGDLPLTLQPKLLRLLEQRTYRPVGGDRNVQFHARVIAATHVNLEKAVEAGQFRKDLYFRISAQEVYVPPLRERIPDIKLLAYHFLEKCNNLCHRQVKSISASALRVLEAYDWRKNNVRELEREILRAVVRAGVETELKPEMLFWKRGKHSPPRAKGGGDYADLMDLPYAEAVSEMKSEFGKRYVLHRLEESRWNKSKAAEKAGMKPSNFHRLMKQLDLNP